MSELSSSARLGDLAPSGKGSLARSAAEVGRGGFGIYRHRDHGDRRRSSQFRLWTSFRSLAGTDPKTAFYGRKRKAWRDKQARRQLCPSVTHSWRSGDRGSRAERSDEERLALRASGSAAFQRRHRRLGKQDRSCRMGGHVGRANLSKGRLIAGRPTVSAVRGKRTHDGKPVGPELANPAGCIGLQSPPR
jgi:hypothetical protein